MYGACILSKLECICTKAGLYSKYIRTSACVLTLGDILLGGLKGGDKNGRTRLK